VLDQTLSATPWAPQALIFEFSNKRPKVFLEKNFCKKIPYKNAIFTSFIFVCLTSFIIIIERMNSMWHYTDAAKGIIAMGKKAVMLAPAITIKDDAFITPIPSRALDIQPDSQVVTTNDNENTLPVISPLISHLLEVTENSEQSAEQAQNIVYMENMANNPSIDELYADATLALKNGQTEKAISLYIQAITQNPEDAFLRHNLVSLLLHQAAFYDERKNDTQAISYYAQALKAWRGDVATQEAIRARYNYLLEKNTEE
jgi:tetratricopeptide (TPR) repeat protein